MTKVNKWIILSIGALILIALIVAGCTPKGTPTATPIPTLPPVPVSMVPFYESWLTSGHADAEAEAFNHWNDVTADPDGVPVACAKCHTTVGMENFLNGTQANIAVPGGVINCNSCHNEATDSLSSVTFPGTESTPGVLLAHLGSEARCIVCHSGRESKITVDAALEGKGEDVVDSKLGFINMHYFAAAATEYGSQVKGGYEYEGAIYDMKFTHVEDVNDCLECHDQHSLDVKLETCSQCHENAKANEDLLNIRMLGSTMDYNGNGDVTEGIYYEIRGLQESALITIQAYAREISKSPIAYKADAYPYFFTDTNANGTADEGEGKYTSWTPRLVKAAYNYQMSIKDPGAYAHNAKYVIELLYDSISDLNTQLAEPTDISKAVRNDAAHFAGNTMPFRDWDDTGTVPAGCVKCHTATGLPTFLANGGSVIVTNKGATNIVGVGAAPASNGFMCSTCHDSSNFPDRLSIGEVTMPSGLKVTFGGYDADKKAIADDNNICISCHQGRESTTSVSILIAGKDPDAVAKGLSFRNVHYFAAGASLYGTEAKGMYEFSDQTYLGKNNHPGDGSLANCLACHDTHSLEVNVDTCAVCHSGVTDPRTIRYVNNQTDWNGNGNITESMDDEITGMNEALYETMQKYANDVAGAPLVYSPANYPYFFIDTNANGKPDSDELTRANGYATWTPKLLIAAYNYQYVNKDPGAFAHNPKYVLQVLYDTLNNMGADVSAMTRP